MAYSTQTQVEQKIATARLLKIGDRDEDGILDATVFTDAASQAQAWIQSYCAPRYGATVLAAWDTATPSLIRHISDILIIYFLAEFGAVKLTEQLTTAYKIRMEQLKAIRDGDLDVVDTDGEVITASTTTYAPAYVSTAGENKVFTRQALGPEPAADFPTVFGTLEDNDDDCETRG